MDEAEQLCDRLVVMDNAKIVAEGSPRQLIEEHVSREVLELRSMTASTARCRGRRRLRAARRADRAATGLCWSTRATARQPSSGFTRPASDRRAASSAGRRWRTSSSASPAAPWSTDGCRIAAHRQPPGRWPWQTAGPGLVRARIASAPTPPVGLSANVAGLDLLVVPEPGPVHDRHGLRRRLPDRVGLRRQRGLASSRPA